MLVVHAEGTRARLEEAVMLTRTVAARLSRCAGGAGLEDAARGTVADALNGGGDDCECGKAARPRSTQRFRDGITVKLASVYIPGSCIDHACKLM